MCPWIDDAFTLVIYQKDDIAEMGSAMDLDEETVLGSKESVVSAKVVCFEEMETDEVVAELKEILK